MADDIPEVDEINNLLDSAAGSAVSTAIAGGTLEDLMGPSGSSTTTTSASTPAEPAPKPTAGGAGDDESEEDAKMTDPFAILAEHYRRQDEERARQQQAQENMRFVATKMAEEAGLVVANGTLVPAATADPEAVASEPVVQVVNRFGHVVGVAPGELTDSANAGKYLTLQGSQVKTSDGLVDLALVQANLDKYFPPPAEQTPTKSGRKWPIRFK